MKISLKIHRFANLAIPSEFGLPGCQVGGAKARVTPDKPQRFQAFLIY
jgi:hypothetical protein